MMGKLADGHAGHGGWRARRRWLLPAALACVALSAAADANLFVGTLGSGHTTPAAAYPNGMAQPGPDTGRGDWAHCGGYRFDETNVFAFSQTHLSGTGCNDLGDIGLLPLAAADKAAPGMSLAMRKETEAARPGYYAVTLANGVKAEMTAAPHVACHRYTWPGEMPRRLLVDFQWGMTGEKRETWGRVLESDVRVTARGFEGTLRVKRWGERTVHFVVAFSEGGFTAEKLPPADKREKAPRYAVAFPAGGALVVHVGLSAFSAEGARKNLASETDTFDRLVQKAEAAWADVLGRVEVKGGSPAARTAYETALYHLFVSPNNVADAGDAPWYSTFSTWDTFRAAHPLYTLVAPERVPGFVGSMLRHYDAHGYLPMWSLWRGEVNCMIGNHAVPIVVDAYLKGLAGVDGARLMEAVDGTLRKAHKGRPLEDWANLDKYGYYPFDLSGWHSASRTLEGSYDDACAARLADALGRKAAADFYRARSKGWTNLYDAATGFFRGKDARGKFREPFDPMLVKGWSDKTDDYIEANAWQYNWHVMQEPDCFARLFGGKAALAARLEKFFTIEGGLNKCDDVSGLVGQYAHGNEPGHHAAYLFQYAGRGDLTAKYVREICRRFYTDAPDGLCGNEDCGQMSAWYLFSAAGFYPVDPCGGEYVLGAPQFPEVVFRLAGGKTFRVVAKNFSEENRLVKSVRLNGKPIDGFVIRHADVMAGGTLEFEMYDPAERKDYYFDTSWRIGDKIDNAFADEAVTTNALPDAAAFETRVPRAVWDGHGDVVRAHAAAWKMVGAKLHRPEPATGFKRNFVYTPFGNSVFVWGSCFVTMYGQYAANVFPFIEQLDNFYAAQRKDGFIPRQLGIYDGRSQFAPDDLSSVGGNIFAWAEWEWFCQSGDRTRLKKAYPVLLAYHEWMRRNRTWKDGTYFSSGWGCGMDNIPRVDTAKYSRQYHHGFLSWVDVTLQQLLDAWLLDVIGDVLRLPEDKELKREIADLKKIVNEKMWDEGDGLYHDLDRDGNRVPCRHIGGFWALLVPDLVPPERRRRLIANLEDPALFAAPCGTRSLAKGEEGYDPDGGCYWRGGVWCITDWMIVRGLSGSNEPQDLAAAHRLARRHVEAVAKVYAETGTIWESYDPERVAPGKLYGHPVRRDFVGFSGVTPIAMLVRDVFGIRVKRNEIVWDVRLLERHGVENLTLPDGNVVSLVCAARKTADEKPVVEVRSSRPVKLTVRTADLGK